MNNFFRTLLIINLVSIALVASLSAVYLPILFQQQRALTIHEVKTSLSLFEISARQAVNTQDKTMLKELAEQLLRSPSIHYVKVTDQNNNPLIEQGLARQEQAQTGQSSKRLAQQFNIQSQPAQQTNPLAWVEIELNTPNNIYDWLKVGETQTTNLIAMLIFMQLMLSLIGARLLRSKHVLSANKLTEQPSLLAPAAAEQQATAEQQALATTQQLTEAKIRQQQDQAKIKQLVALSSRANTLKRALLKQLEHAWYVVDEHNHVIEASQPGLAFLGITAEQLLQTNLNDYFQPRMPTEQPNAADFMELLISYPEDFCLFVTAKHAESDYYASYFTLRFRDDTLYLVKVVPMPKSAEHKLGQIDSACALQQLQPADLYSPLKSACLDTLKQVNDAILNDTPDTFAAADASLRLSSLVRCLPWLQSQPKVLNTLAYSPIHLFEQRLSVFAPLLAHKHIDWTLLINPELKLHYNINLALIQAIVDLQLYVISLCPHGTQVLLQLDHKPQQLQLNIDVEQADLLLPMQQSLLACCAVLLQQIDGELQHTQGSLCFTLPLSSSAETSIFQEVSATAAQIQVLIDLPNAFIQRSLSLQMQLFGFQLRSAAQLEQIEASRPLWYISATPAQPDWLSTLKPASLRQLICIDAPQNLGPLEFEQRYCLRPRFTSYLYEQLTSNSSGAQQLPPIDVQDLCLASIAAEALKDHAAPRLVVLAVSDTTPADYISDLSCSDAFQVHHCTPEQITQSFSNIAQIDCLVVTTNALRTAPLAGFSANNKLLSLIILQGDEPSSELPPGLAKLNHQQVQLPIQAAQLAILIRQLQARATSFEQLFQDEQLLDTVAQTEQQYQQLIAMLSTPSQAEADLRASVTRPSKANWPSYLTALYPIFKLETQQRLAQIKQQLTTQHWGSVQQVVQEIRSSAQKFNDEQLTQLLNDMLQASFRQDQVSLEQSSAKLVQHL